MKHKFLFLLLLITINIGLVSATHEVWDGNLSKGILVYYAFEDSSSLNETLDVYTYVHNLSALNTVNDNNNTYVKGKGGSWALNFTANLGFGINEVKFNVTLTNLTEFSYAFWIYPYANGTQYLIKTTQSGNQNTDRRIYIFNTGNLSFRLGNGTGTRDVSYGIDTNKWTHIVITAKNSTIMRLYMNGVEKTNNSGGINFSSTLGDNTYYGSEAVGSDKLNAILDEFAIWNRVLNQTEINYLYNNGEGTSYLYDLKENSQTYNKETYSGSSETFKINITYDSSYYTGISASLFYNNTFYSATSTGSGNDLVFSRSINTPYVINSINKTFYWNISLEHSSDTIYYISKTNNQSIINFTMDNCSYFTQALLNYTLKDEGTKLNIDGGTYNGTIEVFVQIFPSNSLVEIFNYSTNKTKTNNLSVCVNEGFLNGSYKMYAQARYYASSYVTEFHHIQNLTITNTGFPQIIGLYDLLAVDSTEFIVTVKDKYGLALQNGLVNVQRKYVSDGDFKTVEIAKTGTDGKARIHLDTNNVEYTIIVYKGGYALETFANVVPYCEDTTIAGNCLISLNIKGTTGEIPNFYHYFNVDYSFAFNETARKVTVTFARLDSTTGYMSLNLTKFDNYGNVTLCADNSTSESGTLSCIVPSSYGNVTFIATLYKEGTTIASNLYTIRLRDIFEGLTVILIIGLFLTLVFMFPPSLFGTILGSVMGMVIGIILVGVSGSIIGAGSWLVWMVFAIFIILYKASKGGNA